MNVVVQPLVDDFEVTIDNGLIKQAKRLVPVFFALYVPAFCVILSLYLVWLTTDHRISELTRDPLSVMETRIHQARIAADSHIVDSNALLPVQPWLGAVSSAGIILWTIAGAVALFTSWLITPQRSMIRTKAGFFLGTGILSFMLMGDDLFLLHERVFPESFNLREEFLIGLYAFILISILYVWRRYILSGDYILLFLALFFFGISVSIDSMPMDIPQRHFFEDGSKFVGIMTWTMYICRNAVQALNYHFSRSKSEPVNAS
ncbi:MAG: hypothetical protein COA73_11645 [Candidatus Hydrogenedentota bacterium]|nr:MAG: hypothetical protein COA73_11645 [Candidatus Hydrogenedentota bacterium]